MSKRGDVMKIGVMEHFMKSKSCLVKIERKKTFKKRIKAVSIFLKFWKGNTKLNLSIHVTRITVMSYVNSKV